MLSHWGKKLKKAGISLNDDIILQLMKRDIISYGITPAALQVLTLLDTTDKETKKLQSFQPTQTLLKLDLASLQTKLQQNIYKRETDQEYLYAIEDKLMFQPTTSKDHLATPFMDVHPKLYPGNAGLRILMKYSGEDLPGMDCLVLIQDQNLRSLKPIKCYETDFQMKPGTIVRTIPLFQKTSRVRLTFRNFSNSFMQIPDFLQVEEGFFKQPQ